MGPPAGPPGDDRGPAGRPGRPSFRRAWADGARLTLDEAVAYVRRSRGARRRPAIGWASLTPTELDVVRLVVDGLSNPEIGSRLFVSRGTVKTHLSHVYAKLGVANRTELATLATPRLAKADDPEKGARSERTTSLEEDGPMKHVGSVAMLCTEAHRVEGVPHRASDRGACGGFDAKADCI